MYTLNTCHSFKVNISKTDSPNTDIPHLHSPSSMYKTQLSKQVASAENQVVIFLTRITAIGSKIFSPGTDFLSFLCKYIYQQVNDPNKIN